MLLRKKLWYNGKNYDTIPKTMELLLWNGGKNYGTGTIVNYRSL